VFSIFIKVVRFCSSPLYEKKARPSHKPLPRRIPFQSYALVCYICFKAAQAHVYEKHTMLRCQYYNTVDKFWASFSFSTLHSMRNSCGKALTGSLLLAKFAKAGVFLLAATASSM